VNRRRFSGDLRQRPDPATEPALAQRQEARGPRLTDLPPAARPREKLLSRGAAALSHAELVALLLGSGTRTEHVVALATRLLRRHPLDDLAQVDASRLMDQAGIGPAGVARIMAGLELGRRASIAVDDLVQVTSPADAWLQLRDLGVARRERLVGLYLDGRNRLLARETLSVGSLNTTRTHPREILEPALRHLALGFILAHNHPGGSPEPSPEDLAFTRGIGRAARVLDLGFYDHLVITRKGYTSLRERGLMPADGSW
jgi:DNA repair protein RadC